MPAKWPRLGLVACLYHSLRATSCEAERKRSSLLLLIADSRTRKTTTNVVQGHILNKGSIPKVVALTAVTRR